MPYYWFTRRHVQRHKRLPDFILCKFLNGVLSIFLLDLETAASMQLLNVSIDLIFLSADLELVRESVKRALKYHSYDDFRKIDRWKCRQHYCAAALYSGGKSFRHDITEIPFLSCFHQFIYIYRSLFDGFSCKKRNKSATHRDLFKSISILYSRDTNTFLMGNFVVYSVEFKT